MPANEQSAAVLIEQFCKLFGLPTGATSKLVAWSIGEFEVAVQVDEGPHVWVSQRWRPKDRPCQGLQPEPYPAGKKRHKHLVHNAPSLADDHAARCFKNVTDNVSAVVRCIRAYAVEAGVLSSEDGSTAPTSS